MADSVHCEWQKTRVEKKGKKKKKWRRTHVSEMNTYIVEFEYTVEYKVLHVYVHYV